MTRDDTSRNRTLLILGASGDLTARLLLPGLGAVLAAGRGANLQLVGSAVDDWNDDRWRGRITESFAEVDAEGPEVDAVIAGTRYIRADATDEKALRGLFDACSGQPILYFALAPAITEKVCHALTGLDLPTDTQLVIEKPFGHDAASATALNELLSKLVPEKDIHRVDHFVAMPTVLNVLGVRFANRIVEPLLNNQHVESVDIVFDESLALEGRAGFYDSTGALLDMIQSHLLEVMSLFAMEPVPTLGEQDVLDAKAQVLRSTSVWDDDPVAFSRRARYTAGSIDGHEVASYVDEDGIDPDRKTETFAEIVVAVKTWRWSGVPFRLRSGKAFGTPRAEIVVTFKPPPLIPAGMTGTAAPDRLRIGIRLDANALQLDLNITGADDPFHIDHETLGGEFGPGRFPPYGEVLLGVFEGKPQLSVRGDMSVRCWEIIEPVRAAWADDDVPLLEYAAGSDGPEGWPISGLPGRGEQR